MNVYIVKEMNYEFGDGVKVENIGVYENECDAQERCDLEKKKSLRFCGNWDYDYEEFELM